jgi:hypothetical protein
MKHINQIVCGLLLLVPFTSFKKDKSWTNLLDKNLTNWETYLSYRHTTSYTGAIPKDASGKIIEPFGYNKEQDVFTIVEEKGEPVLRVSGEVYGCVFTKEEYENYHLKLKVRWGKNKHVPRMAKLKDSGILYHSIGKSGVDYWRAWMLSQEFQIMEGHMGDYWNIANAAIDIRAYLPEGKMNSIASKDQPFLPFGSGSGEGFCMRSANKENRNGEWTDIELICYEGKSLHIVNGEVVMVLQNSRYMENGKAVPLRKGKIQLQSEAAEVFFKNIQIKTIPSLPTEYASLFHN